MVPKIKGKLFSRSREGAVLRSKKQAVMSPDLQPKLAVVEVRNGENQEEAWRRYLAENPKNAGIHIRIFHYSRPRTLVTERGNREILPFIKRGNRP